MRTKSGAHAAILLLGLQHLLPKFEIAFVDILLVREGDFGRLAVGPFDQSNRGPTRQKVRQVVFGSLEISLQAYTDVGMRGEHSAIEIQGSVHVVAGLHVHPDDGVLLCALNNGLQMFAAEIRGDRKSTRLNSSHALLSRMPSSA